MAFEFYNNNPLGRRVSDCAVRAIALATRRSWDKTYEELSNFARQRGITFSEVEFINEYLDEQYPTLSLVANRITTVQDFLDLNFPGRWLITMSGHITCVIDGVIYDTFDPSKRYVHCIYKVE